VRFLRKNCNRWLDFSRLQNVARKLNSQCNLKLQPEPAVRIVLLARCLQLLIPILRRHNWSEGDTGMSRRESELLWLKDMLEQLTACQQQLDWTQDADAVAVLTESMIRDLDRCRRLGLDLHRRARLLVAA
jgi:hypothetical protein